jgi:hypothetical protein
MPHNSLTDLVIARGPGAAAQGRDHGNLASLFSLFSITWIFVGPGLAVARGSVEAFQKLRDERATDMCEDPIVIISCLAVL